MPGVARRLHPVSDSAKRWFFPAGVLRTRVSTVGVCIKEPGGLVRISGKGEWVRCMAVRKVLRMGDPGLRQVAGAVEAFGTPELQALVADLKETMAAENGAGLAATQIGVPVRVVVFGYEHNPRYPDAPPVPETVLVNPVIEPLTQDEAVTLFEELSEHRLLFEDA